MTLTLGDDYPREQARVRTILGYYKEIGVAGRFGAAIIEATLKEADEAAISGDVVRMLKAYAAMKAIE